MGAQGNVGREREERAKEGRQRRPLLGLSMSDLCVTTLSVGTSGPPVGAQEAQGLFEPWPPATCWAPDPSVPRHSPLRRGSRGSWPWKERPIAHSCPQGSIPGPSPSGAGHVRTRVCTGWGAPSGPERSPADCCKSSLEARSLQGWAKKGVCWGTSWRPWLCRAGEHPWLCWPGGLPSGVLSPWTLGSCRPKAVPPSGACQLLQAGMLVPPLLVLCWTLSPLEYGWGRWGRGHTVLALRGLRSPCLGPGWRFTSGQVSAPNPQSRRPSRWNVKTWLPSPTLKTAPRVSKTLRTQAW